jgi:hypothetical protein
VRRAIAEFDTAADDRMHSVTLAAALGVSQTDLAALLRPLGIVTLPNKFSRGGEERRGYAREDFVTVAGQIASGGLQVPGDVDAWRPTA